MSEANLKIWEAFEKTNPKYTKNFSKSGGFKGTSINATFVAKMLTEKFGPWGQGWGWEIENEDFVKGACLDPTNGVYGTIHIVRVRLWYLEDGKVIKCSPHFGQTTFVGKNKNGVFTDEEAPKKSITDAVTKSASMLGVAADIFTGLYDDNKYVAELKKEFANGNGHKEQKSDVHDEFMDKAAKDLGGKEVKSDKPFDVLDNYLDGLCGDNKSKKKNKLAKFANAAGIRKPWDDKCLHILDNFTADEQAKIVEANKDDLAVPF